MATGVSEAVWEIAELVARLKEAEATRIVAHDGLSSNGDALGHGQRRSKQYPR